MNLYEQVRLNHVRPDEIRFIDHYPTPEAVDTVLQRVTTEPDRYSFFSEQSPLVLGPLSAISDNLAIPYIGRNVNKLPLPALLNGIAEEYRILHPHVTSTLGFTAMIGVQVDLPELADAWAAASQADTPVAGVERLLDSGVFRPNPSA